MVDFPKTPAQVVQSYGIPDKPLLSFLWVMGFYQTLTFKSRCKDTPSFAHSFGWKIFDISFSALLLVDWIWQIRRITIAVRWEGLRFSLVDFQTLTSLDMSIYWWEMENIIYLFARVLWPPFYMAKSMCKPESLFVLTTDEKLKIVLNQCGNVKFTAQFILDAWDRMSNYCLINSQYIFISI